MRQFDKDIGQQLNPQKTKILARRVLKGKLLKQKIQLPVQVSSQVESLGLGRVQQMNKCRNDTMQSNRVAKASDCLKKIRQLPLSPPHKLITLWVRVTSDMPFLIVVATCLIIVQFYARKIGRQQSAYCC